MPTQKRPLSMRVNDETHSLVDKLAAHHGISQTRVVELAVHFLASHEEEAIQQRTEIIKSLSESHFILGCAIEQIIKREISVPASETGRDEISRWLNNKCQPDEHTPANDNRTVIPANKSAKTVTKTNNTVA